MGRTAAAARRRQSGRALGLSAFAEFPGFELVRKGLEDLATGTESTESLLVLVVAPRLRSLDITVPPDAGGGLAKDRLWDLLEHTEGAGAHARYNALLGRALSFATTADRLIAHHDEHR